jgi:hypothetical protein
MKLWLYFVRFDLFSSSLIYIPNYCRYYVIESFALFCSRVRSIVTSGHYLLVYVSVEQLGSLWTCFHEILYLRIFRYSVEESEVLLKSDKNGRYFT